MLIAGIKVVDTALVRDAIEMARTTSEPYLFNHAMRSWLFGVLIAERANAERSVSRLTAPTRLGSF
jgi:hypothetical protein